MHLIGPKNRKSEAYPEPSRGAAAASALRNRNVAGANQLTGSFTPSNSVVAAVLFTPKVSGVLQIGALMEIVDGATSDAFALGAEVVPGTGLSVTDGEITQDGWVMGTSPSPTINGTTGSPSDILFAFTAPLTSGQTGSMTIFGITQPLPIGVPVVIVMLLNSLGGSSEITSLAFTNLSVMELP